MIALLSDDASSYTEGSSQGRMLGIVCVRVCVCSYWFPLCAVSMCSEVSEEKDKEV